MYSCADFLRGFSEYRDGYMDPAERVEAESHLASCAGCSRYVRVYEAGVDELKAIPGVEPSEDFLPRLQHRIYHIDEERAAVARRDGSGASVGFVLAVMAMVTVAAWLPLVGNEPAVVEMPAVAATPPPEAPRSVHALFRAGPLLIEEPEAVPRERETATVFFRYSPLGSYASYRPGTLGLR